MVFATILSFLLWSSLFFFGGLLLLVLLAKLLVAPASPKRVENRKRQPTPLNEIDRIVERVTGKAEEWSNLSANQKLKYLQGLHDKMTDDFFYEWTNASFAGHKYRADDKSMFHAWTEVSGKGPMVTIVHVNQLMDIYSCLATTGALPKPYNVRSLGKHTSGVVWPMENNGLDKAFASGMRTETVCEDAKMAQIDPTTKPAGTVGCLQAGNFEGLYDVLHILFSDNQTAVLKFNPVNGYSGEQVEKFLSELIKDGYVGCVYGEVKEGDRVIKNERINHACMTGSCRTYNAIVWGTPDSDVVKEKKEGDKVFAKPFTAELGAVSPYIIVPGEWTDAQIDNHAQLLVCLKLYNSGHICASPQVVLTSKAWPQREKFIARVKYWIEHFPGIQPYYPNWDKMYQSQVAALQRTAEEFKLGEVELKTANGAKVAFLAGIPERAAKNHYTIKNEAFCPVFCEVTLEAKDVPSFLKSATNFANKELFGSLSGNIIIDDVTRKQYQKEFDEAIDSLQYGAIGVNQWAVFSMFGAGSRWGAYPSLHPAQDIQSGQGQVLNGYGFEKPLKSIVFAPFDFPGHDKVPTDQLKNLLKFQRVADYFIHRTFPAFVRLILNAILGL